MECEYGTCEICGKDNQLYRTYLYYNIRCECCPGDRHFEIIRHCNNCIPEYPIKIHPLIKGCYGRNYKTTITNIYPILVRKQ